MANRYFDAMNGLDTNAGTEAAPWQTVKKCGSLLNGDVALFKCGDTFEFDQYSSYILGNKTGVTYTAYGPLLGIVKPKLKVSKRIIPATWSLYSGTTYVCDFVHTASRACWLDTTYRLLPGSGKDALVVGQYFGDTANGKLYVRLPSDDDPATHDVDYSVQRYAIYATAANVIVENFEIMHGEVAGILAANASMIIRNNTVHTCLTSGIDLQASAETYENLVYGVHNGRAYGASGQGYGISVKGPDQDVYNNVVRDCYGSFLVSANSERSRIYNNLCIDSFVNGIDVGASTQTVGNELEIYNNLVLVNPSPVWGTAGHGIAMQGGASGVKWKNNIVVITYQSGFAYAPNCYSVNGSGNQDWSTTGRNFQFDNNLGFSLYVPADYGNILSAGKTLAQWQTNSLAAGATGADEHSFNVDPKLTDVLNGIYTLLPTSPCIGAGIDVGLTTDADGNAVPGALGYDIGPYSYMPGWTPFDSTMPTLSLASTAPGDLKQVQAWKKVATAREIERY